MGQTMPCSDSLRNGAINVRVPYFLLLGHFLTVTLTLILTPNDYDDYNLTFTVVNDPRDMNSMRKYGTGKSHMKRLPLYIYSPFVLCCIVFIHFYSASNSLSLSEALPTLHVFRVVAYYGKHSIRR